MTQYVICEQCGAEVEVPDTSAPKPDPWRVALDNMTYGTLNCPAFKSAWLDWIQHKKERKQSMPPSTIKLQIRRLEGMGLDDAIQSIANSIAGPWIGLFPPKGNSNVSPNANRSAKPGAEQRDAHGRRPDECGYGGAAPVRAKVWGSIPEANAGRDSG